MTTVPKTSNISLPSFIPQKEFIIVIIPTYTIFKLRQIFLDLNSKDFNHADLYNREKNCGHVCLRKLSYYSCYVQSPGFNKMYQKVLYVLTDLTKIFLPFFFAMALIICWPKLPINLQDFMSRYDL